ncbi:hypothetical protein LXL04_009339 [Taraxacum kok-saghyz]
METENRGREIGRTREGERETCRSVAAGTEEEAGTEKDLPKIEEKHLRCRNKRPREVDLLLASALLWVRKEADRRLGLLATAVGSDGGGQAPAITGRRRCRSFDRDGEREKESFDRDGGREKESDRFFSKL